MPKFEIGDVVQLKSGSPDLVVLSADENVSVAWLDDGVVESMLDRPAVMFVKKASAEIAKRIVIAEPGQAGLAMAKLMNPGGDVEFVQRARPSHGA